MVIANHSAAPTYITLTHVKEVVQYYIASIFSASLAGGPNVKDQECIAASIGGWLTLVRVQVLVGITEPFLLGMTGVLGLFSMISWGRLFVEAWVCGSVHLRYSILRSAPGAERGISGSSLDPENRFPMSAGTGAS